MENRVRRRRFLKQAGALTANAVVGTTALNALAASGDKAGARAALGIATPIVTAMGAPAARLQQGIDDIKARYRL